VGAEDLHRGVDGAGRGKSSVIEPATGTRIGRVGRRRHWAIWSGRWLGGREARAQGGRVIPPERAALLNAPGARGAVDYSTAAEVAQLAHP